MPTKDHSSLESLAWWVDCKFLYSILSPWPSFPSMCCWDRFILWFFLHFVLNKRIIFYWTMLLLRMCWQLYVPIAFCETSHVSMCQVDIAYVPFIERLEIAFSGLKNYDITAGRPNLAKWLKVIFFVSSLCAKWVIVNVCKFMSLFEHQNCLYIVGYSPKNGCFPSSLNMNVLFMSKNHFVAWTGYEYCGCI